MGILWYRYHSPERALGEVRRVCGLRGLRPRFEPSHDNIGMVIIYLVDVGPEPRHILRLIDSKAARGSGHLFKAKPFLLRHNVSRLKALGVVCDDILTGGMVVSSLGVSSTDGQSRTWILQLI
jgi:hypothetical protein